MTNPGVTDVKAALTAGLTELRLPTVRHCYEETARLAERETLSYERYLYSWSRANARTVSGSGSSDCSISPTFRPRRRYRVSA